MSKNTALEMELVEPEMFNEHCKMGQLSLTFTANTTYEEWETITQGLILNAVAQRGKAQRALWAVGDALVHGEQEFGEKAWQIIDPKGYDIKTLQNAYGVCKATPAGLRVEGLSFSHHETVAKLEPADREKLLKEAQESQMTVKQLRVKAREVKESYPVDGKKRKKKKAKEDKSFPVIDLNDESSILNGLDAAIAYITKLESEKHKTKEFPVNRKNAWAKRLVELKNIGRRMGVIK